ncbi:MAG: hypothetical protein AAGD92_11375 [Pseudomonadota bacterium]
MKEAGISVELQMLLLGYETSRTEYGAGGSMEYHQHTIKRIAHSYPDDFFDSFDALQPS